MTLPADAAEQEEHAKELTAKEESSKAVEEIKNAEETKNDTEDGK